MRAGSTVSSEATCRMASAAAPITCTASMMAGHSACQAPAARSCSWTRLVSTVDISAGIRAAEASATAQPAGFRLCGIADDPPPASRASPTSACISRLMSRAILPSTPV